MFICGKNQKRGGELSFEMPHTDADMIRGMRESSSA